MHAILAHHDAPRLRFRQAGPGGAWRQQVVGHESQRVFMDVDLRATGPCWQAVLEAVTARVQRSLDLRHGPLCRVVRFRGPAAGTDRVFMVIHHAVVDGVSWRILLEDLHHLSAGSPLPAKTTSFRRWAAHLERPATTLDPAADAYWQRCADRQRQAQPARPHCATEGRRT